MTPILPHPSIGGFPNESNLALGIPIDSESPICPALHGGHPAAASGSHREQHVMSTGRAG